MLPRMHRPPKLTPEVQEVLLAELAKGTWKYIACARAGISDDALASWLAKGRRGKEPYATFRRSVLLACGQHIDEEEDACKRDPKIRFQILQKKYPQLYGDRATQDHAHELEAGEESSDTPEAAVAHLRRLTGGDE